MLVLLLLVAPVVEVIAFVAVGHAIGWLATVLLLFATSLLGGPILRMQGRAAIERVTLAVAERRAPGAAALDGALGFLGGLLLVLPGFVSDALGALLVLPPTRVLARRLISRRYGGRMVGFLATTGRFASRGRTPRPADVESTAVEDDLGRLDR